MGDGHAWADRRTGRNAWTSALLLQLWSLCPWLPAWRWHLDTQHARGHCCILEQITELPREGRLWKRPPLPRPVSISWNPQNSTIQEVEMSFVTLSLSRYVYISGMLFFDLLQTSSPLNMTQVLQKSRLWCISQYTLAYFLQFIIYYIYTLNKVCHLRMYRIIPWISMSSYLSIYWEMLSEYPSTNIFNVAKRS